MPTNTDTGGFMVRKQFHNPPPRDVPEGASKDAAMQIVALLGQKGK